MSSVEATRTSAAKDSVNKYAEQVQAEPEEREGAAEPDRRALLAGRRSENFNPETNEFTADGKAQLNLLKDDWDDYLKLTDDKPNLATANYAVSGFPRAPGRQGRDGRRSRSSPRSSRTRRTISR